MRSTFLRSSQTKFYLLSLLGISLAAVFTYFFTLKEINFYKDDWYYILDGYKAGARVFHLMFEIDRPARGYFFELIFRIFQTNPLPYHLLSLFLRVSSGAACLWLCAILWPAQKGVQFFAGLLAVLYPGYWWWVESIEYLPMLTSFVCQVLSFAFSFRAAQASKWTEKTIWMLLAAGSGWAALLLVDYAIGMEAFRFLGIAVILLRGTTGGEQFTRLRRCMRPLLQNGLPLLLIPGIYLVWRQLIFNNTRVETDLSFQLGALLANPLEKSVDWAVKWAVSFFNSTLLAWFVPFWQHMLKPAPLESLLSLLQGLATGAAAYWIWRINLSSTAPSEDQPREVGWEKEAIFLGGLGVFFACLPVVAANRVMTFDRFSHYLLPASLAGVLFVLGLIGLLRSIRQQAVAAALLAAIACTAQLNLGKATLVEVRTINDLWWQMGWRAPQVRIETNFVANFYAFDYGEEADFLTAPPIFMYYPEKNPVTPVRYELTGLPMQEFELQKMLVQKSKYGLRSRSHWKMVDREQLLVLSMPRPGACLHVLDQNFDQFSTGDTALTRAFAKFSNTAVISDRSKPPVYPPEIPAFFGQEPPHKWCYFYQKASLAYQLGQYQHVLTLYDEAQGLGFKPVDPIEWMPLLLSAARLGQNDRLAALAKPMSQEPLYLQQACENLTRLEREGKLTPPSLDPAMRTTYCQPK